MHYLSLNQEILYNQYAKLSQNIVELKHPSHNTSLSKYAWDLISKEGFFGLAVSEEYGGKGVSWQDCVVALDGLLCHSPDLAFLGILMSQISIIYLISQYGGEAQKKKYLPRLMQGEIAYLRIADQVHELYKYNSWFSKIRFSLTAIGSQKISIHAKKAEKDVVFYLVDKQEGASSYTVTNDSSYGPSQAKVFIPKKYGLVALHDLANFEKSFYGILAVSFVRCCDLRRKMAY